MLNLRTRTIFILQRVVYVILTCSGLTFFAGCTSFQIEHQALSHNRAFSSSADKILLANIVRSSRLLPVDYTAITDYNAKEVASGSLAGKFPFGADASQLFNLDPTVSFGPGIVSLEIKDFAQQKESFTKLYEEVEIQNFANLVNAGWEGRLIGTLLLQAVRIRGNFARELVERSNKKCKKPEFSKSTQCADIREFQYCEAEKTVEDEFLSSFDEKINPFFQNLIYINSGDNKCEFYKFQALLSRLEMMGIGVDVVSSDALVPVFANGTDDNIYGVAKRKTLEDIYEIENEKLSGKGRKSLEFVGRSTFLMIRYLGQLARSQVHSNKPWTPSIFLGSNAPRVPLFVIHRGSPPNSKTAVSIDYEGETYSLPEADYDAADSHKSLQLFTYVRIRLDQAYAQTRLPPSNTLVVR